MQSLQYLFWRKGWILQHNPQDISEYLNGVFDYKQVKYGNIKKGEGDIVIIGLGKNEWVSIEEYLKHCYGVDRIETSGIFTNVYFSKRFFIESIKHICNH